MIRCKNILGTLSTADDAVDDILGMLSTADEVVNGILGMLSTADESMDNILGIGVLFTAVLLMRVWMTYWCAFYC